jgi:replicative DNA helicase
MARIDARKLSSGFLTDRDFTEMSDTFGFLHAAGFWIDDTPNINWRDLVSGAKKMRRVEGIELLIVDYLGLISNTENSRMMRHDQVAFLSKGLKALSRELDIPIVVLSQLSREAHGLRPNLAQLRESGSVEQDADVVILLWNQGWADDAHEMLNVTMIVEKNRNGATGDVAMAFKPAITRFRESEYHSNQVKTYEKAPRMDSKPKSGTASQNSDEELF